MKKHIFGLAIFSFIVGAAAIVYSMFDTIKVEEVSVPAYPQTYSSKTSCWRMKRETNIASPTVRQAVLNVNTKQLDLELATSENDAPVTAHFFVKNRKGTRYIGSAQSDGADLYEKKIKFTDFQRLAGNLDSFENLYVIAETKIYGESNSPEFDSLKATAVTLDYGR